MKMFCLATCICAALSLAATAEDPFADLIDPPEITTEAPQPTDSCECDPCECDPCECTEPNLQGQNLQGQNSQEMSNQPAILTSTSRLDALERRVAELERTSIDAQECEQIAERVAEEVYLRYATQLRLGIRQPNGAIRSETVRFSAPDQSEGFVLNPGETLYSYTDLRTGQQVRVGAPSPVSVSGYATAVPAYSLPTAEMRVTPAPLNQSRRVFVRPVVQRIPFRGGPVVRGIFRGSQFRPLSSAGSCRVVNGVTVCN